MFSSFDFKIFMRLFSRDVDEVLNVFFRSCGGMVMRYILGSCWDIDRI